jgi:hypothetical protein
MLDYRVRGHRRYEDKTMQQVVIYLKLTTSELAYQTSFTLENTRHDFQVIRLWEQPTSLFLQYPGLLPFAALGQSENPCDLPFNSERREAGDRSITTQWSGQYQDPGALPRLSAADARKPSLFV